MRIKSVTLPSFKNLRDFSISFDTDSPTTMLVGRNGMGKSNLIEALVTIFKDLDGGAARIRETRFPYSIEYTVHNRDISITHDPSLSRNRTNITMDGKQVKPSSLDRAM